MTKLTIPVIDADDITLDSVLPIYTSEIIGLDEKNITKTVLLEQYVALFNAYNKLRIMVDKMQQKLEEIQRGEPAGVQALQLAVASPSQTPAQFWRGSEFFTLGAVIAETFERSASEPINKHVVLLKRLVEPIQHMANQSLTALSAAAIEKLQKEIDLSDFSKTAQEELRKISLRSPLQQVMLFCHVLCATT